MKLVMQTLNCWRNHTQITSYNLLLNIMVCDITDDYGFYHNGSNSMKLVMETLNSLQKNVNIVWDMLCYRLGYIDWNIMVCGFRDGVPRAINY